MIIKDLKKDLFTIPNMLSLFRLLLVPVYISIYLNATENYHYYIAGGILAVSCMTDMIDGKIARKFNMHSVIGQVLDPIADKVTQFALIVCLAIRYAILWAVIVLFVIKEVYQFIAMAVAAKKGKMLRGALMSGKVCTTILFVSLIAMIVFPDIPENIVNIMVYVDIAALTIAFIDYVLVYFRKGPMIVDIDPDAK
jgi:cardiolipin synthase